jgi:hypothetical protein
VRTDVEHALMRVLKTQGTRALARIEASLSGTGLGFRRTSKAGPVQVWQAELTQERALSVVVTRGPVLRAVSVKYGRIEAPPLTSQQRERARVQAAFYERYLAAGKIAYGKKGRASLAPSERLVLVVGELEADVNNGGFRQYLANKGTTVVREAAAALERIGARRTLRLLMSASAEPEDSARWESLDQGFQKVAEDLPGLTMRFLTKAGR